MRKITMKNYLLALAAIVLIQTGLNAQDEEFKDIEYKIIAEGIDSPYKNAQVVCFNKYFNLESMPPKFTSKYGLTDKQLYKKMMLVQLFFSDTEELGLDKIELVRIQENETDIIIEYNIVNSDSTNDDIIQSPFMVAQIPKSKKNIRFIADGIELGSGEDLYIKN